MNLQPLHMESQTISEAINGVSPKLKKEDQFMHSGETPIQKSPESKDDEQPITNLIL
jgi:hypothetical protein